MGRRRQAYKLEKRGNGIWYVVGTTPDGRRLHRSTRTRARKAAAQRLPLIVGQEEAGGRATFSEVVDTPLEELLAQVRAVGIDSCILSSDFGQPSTWIFLNKSHKDFQSKYGSHSKEAPWYSKWSWTMPTADGKGRAAAVEVMVVTPTPTTCISITAARAQNGV